MLKKRVSNIFRKRRSDSEDSRGTPPDYPVENRTQEIEERSVIDGIDRNSIHSNWSDTIPMDTDAEYCKIYNNRSGPFGGLHASPIPSTAQVPLLSSTETHKTVKNLFLFLYKPKPDQWGNWHIKNSQPTSSLSVNPIPEDVEKRAAPEEEVQEEVEFYEPQSPDYLPRHPPEFYKDE